MCVSKVVKYPSHGSFNVVFTLFSANFDSLEHIFKGCYNVFRTDIDIKLFVAESAVNITS